MRAEPFDEMTDFSVCGVVRDAFTDHGLRVKVAIARLYISDAKGGYRLLRVRIYDAETDEIIIEDTLLADAMTTLDEVGIGFHLVEAIGIDGEPIIRWSDDLRPFVPVLNQAPERQAAAPAVVPRELTAARRDFFKRLNGAGQNS